MHSLIPQLIATLGGKKQCISTFYLEIHNLPSQPPWAPSPTGRWWCGPPRHCRTPRCSTVQYSTVHSTVLTRRCPTISTSTTPRSGWSASSWWGPPWCPGVQVRHSVIVEVLPSDDSSPPSRLIPLHREEVEPDPGVSPFHLGLAAAGAGQGLRHAAGGQVSSVSTIH